MSVGPTVLLRNDPGGHDRAGVRQRRGRDRRHSGGSLHWRLLDREIIDEVARMAGVEKDVAERCDERLDPLLHRVFKGVWRGGFETSTTALSADPFDSVEMTRCARAVIEKAADEGNCVIVGRGAQCVLGERQDALHVFLWAPRTSRLRRVRSRLPRKRTPRD